MALQSVTLTLKLSLIFQNNEENFTFVTFKTEFNQMEASVFKDVSSSFLVINCAIMTSLLLLRIIYVLPNFLDFIGDLTI